MFTIIKVVCQGHDTQKCYSHPPKMRSTMSSQLRNYLPSSRDSEDCLLFIGNTTGTLKVDNPSLELF